MLPEDRIALRRALHPCPVWPPTFFVVAEGRNHHTDADRLDDEHAEATKQNHHHLNVSPLIPYFPLRPAFKVPCLCSYIR
jgi:hypothetical protein